MTLRLLVACDGELCPVAMPLPLPAETAREKATAAGWLLAAGGDLCPDCRPGAGRG